MSEAIPFGEVRRTIEEKTQRLIDQLRAIPATLGIPPEQRAALDEGVEQLAADLKAIAADVLDKLAKKAF